MITSFTNTMCNFSFRGRSTRKEFICFIVMSAIISLIFLSLISTLAVVVLQLKFDAGVLSIPHKMKNLGILPFIILAVTSVMYFMFNIWACVSGALLAIRRLHDFNCSGIGYWIWIAAIIAFSTAQTSLLTGILFYFIIGSVIFLAVKESFPYENKYGKVVDGNLMINI
ncbi:MAG: DUF805 domain-containing protein [Candidatus Gastranaerophilaceae bacterium]